MGSNARVPNSGTYGPLGNVAEAPLQQRTLDIATFTSTEPIGGPRDASFCSEATDMCMCRCTYKVYGTNLFCSYVFPLL